MSLSKSTQEPQETVDSLGNDSTASSLSARTVSFLELERVLLKGPILRNEKILKQVPLVPLNCSFEVVKEDGDGAISLQTVVHQQQWDGASDVTIVFAVRRPGCGNCREHGLQLHDLASHDKQVSLIGVVKETGVADRELLNFYQHYFRCPIYKDTNWKVFHAMGGRKVSFGTLVFRHLFRNQQRHKRKKIENVPFGGDMYTQGGLLFFDKKGTLRFAYDEVFGEELNMNAVYAAIHFTRMTNKEEQSQRNRSRINEEEHSRRKKSRDSKVSRRDSATTCSSHSRP